MQVQFKLLIRITTKEILSQNFTPYKNVFLNPYIQMTLHLLKKLLHKDNIDDPP